MKTKHKWLLCAIILAAVVLRLYRLSDVPPGVNRDEASIGVTAYSLMTTGMDEYARPFPVSFESFGDWKLPLYIYTTIPFVKLFGVSEIAVRLPSAIAGILSVVAVFYFTKLLFASEAMALLAAAVLAVMPWHIHISRVESEAIVAVFLAITGSLLFILSMKDKSPGKLTASAISFGLTYYTYHGNHVSTTLLLIGLFGIYGKEVLKIPRWWVAVGIGFALTAGILFVTLSADRTKIGGISIFGDPTVIHTKLELPRLEHDAPDSLVAKMMHNRVTYALRTVFGNYLTSYGPEFLFIKGGGNRAHNIQGYGNLHPVEAPLLLLGVVWLFLNFKSKHARYVLWWIIIGGVAAAITKDAPHSNRMLMVVPALAVTVAAGIVYLTRLVPKRILTIIFLILAGAYLSSLLTYLDRYFVHFPKTEAANWGYGYRQLTPALFGEEYAGRRVIMTKPETSPYIYLLFYSGYPPAEYQRQAKRYPVSRDGFTDVAGFGRFSFRAVDWEKDLSLGNTLIVAPPDEVPSALSPKIVNTVVLPDNTTQFVVVDTEK